jgi:hypothetical protein
MPARDMAAYMRARQKAEREATEPVVDIAIPRDALLKESDKELSRVWAKVDAIGPGAVITKTHGRLDVLTREDFKARGSALSRGAVYKPPTPAAAPLGVSTRRPSAWSPLAGSRVTASFRKGEATVYRPT